MAPKKAMKVVAKAAAKKSVKAVKKDGPNKLTEENMTKHNDILKMKFKDSEDVAQHISMMSKNEQMILWKRCLSDALYVCVYVFCVFAASSVMWFLVFRIILHAGLRRRE